MKSFVLGTVAALQQEVREESARFLGPTDTDDAEKLAWARLTPRRSIPF
jgi:hypothetical protein